MPRFIKFLPFVLLLGPFSALADESAKALFSRYQDRIVQVRVIDKEAQTKSSLGTGFLVASDGLIATNYHVISSLIHQPGEFRLEYENTAGGKGELELLDIDVVSDLALLRAEPFGLEPLLLPDREPDQGETIYSIGNPYDIGFTVVPGTYNGLRADSYYQQIHFSGSVNAGMSGGPVLDTSGGVVGINVASAGNQVSFLVPVAALRRLIESWTARGEPVTDFKDRIREQLTANQRNLIDRALAGSWPVEVIGDATALGELKPYVKCWGSSSDEEEDDHILYKYISNTCQTEHHIYLAPGFSTGVISYQVFWMEANELSPTRFYSYYQSFFENFVPDNSVREDDAGEFHCDDWIVQDEMGQADKVVLCARAYVDYPGLYDALYIRGSVDWKNRAFVSHFTLAGVDRDSIGAFMNRFAESMQR